MDQLARRAALRHYLRSAADCGDRRRSPADLGSGDGTVHALKVQHRRAGLEVRDEQARHQHRGGAQRHDAFTSRTARRTSTRARWGCWPRSTAAPKGSSARPVKWALLGFQGGYSLAGHRRRPAYCKWTTAPTCSAFDVTTGSSSGSRTLGTHPEGLAGARRRQALHRHRERQVLHPQAAHDRLRDPERSCSAPRPSPRRSSPRRPCRAGGSTSSRRRRLYCDRQERRPAPKPASRTAAPAAASGPPARAGRSRRAGR